MSGTLFGGTRLSTKGAQSLPTLIVWQMAFKTSGITVVVSSFLFILHNPSASALPWPLLYVMVKL